MKKGSEIEVCLNCKQKNSLNFEEDEIEFDPHSMELKVERRYSCLYEDCEGFISVQTLRYKVGECLEDTRELED
jgi:hypothetical protein